MKAPAVIRATPLEADWLCANFPGCRPRGKGLLLVPDSDTVEDALYHEVRDSKGRRLAFFRKLRLKVLTASTMHEGTRDPLDMSTFIPSERPVRFEPAWIPEDEEEEEFF